MHPELIAERFTLRPLREADVPAITAACQDNEITRWCVSVPLNYTEETALNFVNYTLMASETGKEYVWGIDYSGIFAGIVTLHEIEETSAELGFWMAPEMRGKGILTEALRVMMGFAFDPLGLGFDQLGWTAIVGNRASYKVAQKVGIKHIKMVEAGTPGRPAPNGDETFHAAWKGYVTREEWLDQFFTV